MKPSDIPTFHPQITVLTRKQAKAIHMAALEILEKPVVKWDIPKL